MSKSELQNTTLLLIHFGHWSVYYSSFTFSLKIGFIMNKYKCKTSSCQGPSWSFGRLHRCTKVTLQNKPTINRSYNCQCSSYIHQQLNSRFSGWSFSSVNSSILPPVVWGVLTVSPVLSCVVLPVRSEHRNIMLQLQCQTCRPLGRRTMSTRRHEAHGNLQSSVAITAFLRRKHNCQSSRGEMCSSELLCNI